MCSIRKYENTVKEMKTSNEGFKNHCFILTLNDCFHLLSKMQNKLFGNFKINRQPYITLYIVALC